MRHQLPLHHPEGCARTDLNADVRRARPSVLLRYARSGDL
jgi:hypothetical protein